jgi:AGCS family alanine or glycine:cation symporter
MGDFDLMGTLIEPLNDLIWHDYVLFAVLGVGVLFTIWSGFSQYRALTHGVQVVAGRYEQERAPGAISHFQALSAALSATVGLGNITGVAIAISVGGPGAVFWMWVTGFIGMALKLAEVTQAMLHRNLDDPANPSGGAMWVVSRGLAARGPRLAVLGKAVGAIFCVTLIISAITGGNMFQAWSVASISGSSFGWDRQVVGAVLMLLVGLVIVGGIRRIGSVAGRLVPLMCGIYLLGGLVVVAANAQAVPGLLRRIVEDAFAASSASGAFLGGAAGFAFLKGMQRALFSNEAGQGSSPIAHCAARTEEPAREGVVAGLEPFIDTLVVCTITALVILASGEWNREAALGFERPPAVLAAAGLLDPAWTLEPVPVTVRDAAEAQGGMSPGQGVFAVLEMDGPAGSQPRRRRLDGSLQATADGAWTVEWGSIPHPSPPRLAEPGVFFDFPGPVLTAKAFDRTVPGLGRWMVPLAAWLFALSTMISWSYYGEQGIVFLFGRRFVGPYRWVYCALVFVACHPSISSDEQMDIISSLGTGVMLWANIPIMLLFGPMAMRAYHDYSRRLRAGEFARRR